MAFLFFVITAYFSFKVFQFYLKRISSESAAESYLYVLLFLSLCVLIFTETASLFSQISYLTIRIFWFCIAFISLIIWWKTTDRKWVPVLKQGFALNPSVIIVSIVSLITLIISLTAFPNNWDSMTYHLSRVMHWIQSGNVHHYPTHIERQISQPPLSEFYILHFYLLSGIDRFANLVQWFFMTGSLAVVWLIAKELKADNKIAMLTVLFVSLLPMGILQSSSTQNDYVVSFFIACCVLFLFRIYGRGFSIYQIALFSLTVSLACLSKGTAYIYLLPVIVFYGVLGLMQLKWKVYQLLLTGIIFFIGINGTFLLRNYQTFQQPLAVDSTLQNEVVGVQPLLSNTSKNVAMHLLTPFSGVNTLITSCVDGFHRLTQIDMNDTRYNWQYSPAFKDAKSIPHEDYAGNPFHMLFIGCVIVWILFHSRKLPAVYVLYIVIIIAMLSVFSILLKWQVWHYRLHLPVFIIATPLLAFFVARQKELFQKSIILIFILYALPFLFYNWSRPMVSKDSIFTNSMYDQYFFNQMAEQRPFFDMSAIIQRNGMQNIGWVITGDSWEYPMWVLLADIENLRMEHILVQNASAKWEDPDFIPDGIINKTIIPDSVGQIYYHGNAYQLVYENNAWMFMQRIK